MIRLAVVRFLLVAWYFGAVLSPAAQVDLSVDAVAQPDPADAASPLSYVVTIQNTGDLAAGDVVVTNQVDGAIFMVATTTRGSYALEDRKLVHFVGALEPGGTVTIQITAMPSGGGMAVLASTVFGAETESVLYNNSITTQTIITGEPNLRPVAVLESPAIGAILMACEDVSISGTATDADDEIAKIEAYVNGVKIGAKEGTTFNFLWRKAAAGTFTVRLEVTDTRRAVTVVEQTVQVVAERKNAFANAQYEDGKFYCGFSGEIGTSCVIEASTDFSEWSEVARIEAGAISAEWVDGNASGPRKIYRAIQTIGELPGGS